MSLTWDQFVATHAAAVLTAALRVVANPTDAEDVAQEVFLEIFRSNKFPQLQADTALLKTMAMRRALDRLRRHKKSVELTGGEPDTGDFEPCEYVIANELEDRLRQSLADLPARESEVFCLIYFEQQTAAEVARTLEISTGAVAKSLCMARFRLAAALSRSATEKL